VPANIKYLGYDVPWRFNVATPPSGEMGMRLPYSVPVKTAEEFDKWVRGAMAELSDNANTPESLTYQKVTELSQHLHTPAKPEAQRQQLPRNQGTVKREKRVAACKKCCRRRLSALRHQNQCGWAE
jgi:hypothetical protein